MSFSRSFARFVQSPRVRLRSEWCYSSVVNRLRLSAGFRFCGYTNRQSISKEHFSVTGNNLVCRGRSQHLYFHISVAPAIRKNEHSLVLMFPDP